MGIVFALSGFAAIGNEIIWTRFLTLILENNVYTYTLTLTVILLGIVIGSLLASMFTNDLRKSIFRFGALQIITGIVTFAIIMAPAEIVWISFMENVGTTNISQQLMLIGLIMLIPSILAGMAFPIGIRLATSGVTSAGAIVVLHGMEVVLCAHVVAEEWLVHRGSFDEGVLDEKNPFQEKDLILEDLEAELADTEFHGIQVHMMNQVLHQSKLIQVDLTLLPLETVVDKTHKVDKEFFQQ
jgi:hypothetical protein